MLALMARAPSLRSQLSLDHKQLAGAGTLNDQQQDFPEPSLISSPLSKKDPCSSNRARSRKREISMRPQAGQRLKRQGREVADVAASTAAAVTAAAACIFHLFSFRPRFSASSCDVSSFLHVSVWFASCECRSASASSRGLVARSLLC